MNLLENYPSIIKSMIDVALGYAIQSVSEDTNKEIVVENLRNMQIVMWELSKAEKNDGEDLVE